ncbi:MAG: efflux RND transporter periplasmic adaptor subunit [Chitinophagales bacterium]
MKKTIIYSVALLVLASCGASKSNDPKAELEALKKERSALDEKIKDLEKSIALNDTSKATKDPLLVSFIEAKTQTFVHYVEIQGRIDANENVTVTPQIPGVISSVYVHEGQNVSKGQVLAETDHAAMQKNVETLQTQLAFAKDVYNKQKALWDQKIGSEVQYLSAKNNVETLEASIAAANEQIAMTRLVSPISGVVDAVDIKVGQIASPGYNGIRVVNMSSLKATGEVSESHSAVVSQGDKVIVVIPDLNKEINGTITFASKVINPQSRTFTTEAKLPTDNLLKPNMVTVMRIADYENDKAFVVDLNLIQHSSDASFLYVVTEKDGKMIAERRIVEVGKSYNGLAEITGGLQESDKVINAGLQNLVAGQEVRF